MGHNGNSYYIGIDLNDSYAMVSFFQQNMKEPETVSTVAGSEEFQIPLVLARRKSIGKWYYGDEARRLSKSGEMVCIDQLLHLWQRNFWPCFLKRLWNCHPSLVILQPLTGLLYVLTG